MNILVKFTAFMGQRMTDSALDTESPETLKNRNTTVYLKAQE